jgi:hypothetical protein
MRYGREIVQFWQIGYRLFHGKLLRFMCRIRNFGQVLDGTSEKGFFDPLSLFQTEMSEEPIDDIELEEAEPVDGSLLDVSLVEEVNSNSQELLLRCL